MASYKITQLPSEGQVEYVSLKSARKFFAVDASGSTGGTPMRSERIFVERFHDASTNAAEDSVCRWGSHCNDPTSTWHDFAWISDCGGTSVSTILNNEKALGAIHSADCWFLLTDGEVWDVTAFASLATEKEVFGCPTVFMITSSLRSKPGEANVSVGITSYANCRDAVCLFKDYFVGRIYVIAAKGCFQGLDRAKDRESWDGLTSFDTEAELIAKVDELDIKVQAAHTRQGLPSGISLGSEWDAAHQDPTLVDLQLLLRAGSLSDEELSLVLSEEGLDVLTLAYKTRGKLAEFRAWLLAQKIDQVAVQLKDVAGASALIVMLGQMDLSNQKKEELQAELRAAHVKNRENYLTALSNDTTAPARARNRLVDAALRQLAEVEKAGYSADILNRRSNRARRADDVSADGVVEISTLDFNAPAYKGHCLVCCGDDEIMSVALRVLDPEAMAANTDDFALDFPLAAGRFSANTNVLSSQHICFQCALFGNPGRSIYNENIAAVFPILEYAGSNKLYINQQLYKSLTGGLKVGVPIVGQLFATILNRTLETKEWAGAKTSIANQDPETTRRKEGLEFMLQTVLANLRCRETFNEQGQYVMYPQALKWAAKDFQSEGLQAWIIGYPIAGFNQLIRFGSMMEVLSETEIHDMKAMKLLHSLTSAYLAKVLANQGNPRDWTQILLDLVFAEFNANLVPRYLGPDKTIVADVDVFWSKLRAWLSADPDLFGGWTENGKATIMPKLQVLIFWLVYFQKAHTSAKTYFTNLKTNEPLAAVILNPTQEFPLSLAMDILLSPFLDKAKFLNAQVAAKHRDGFISFKTPFGASVLQCGHPDCSESFLPADIKLDEYAVLAPQLLHKIRQGRAKHLVEVFGTAESFRTNETGLPEPTTMPKPPTSAHVTLHLGISRAWAALSVGERRAVIKGDVKNFVDKAVNEICGVRRGNVFQEGFDQDILNVIPSFFDALSDALIMAGKDGNDVALYEHDFTENKMEFKVGYEVRLNAMRAARK